MLTTIGDADLVKVLEAERLRRCSRLEAQERLNADLRDLIAVLADALGYRP